MKVFNGLVLTFYLAAMSVPTALAAARFPPPLPAPHSSSRLEAQARVSPFSSSMAWTNSPPPP